MLLKGTLFSSNFITQMHGKYLVMLFFCMSLNASTPYSTKGKRSPLFISVPTSDEVAG